MRSRVSFLTLLLIVGSFAIPHFAYASIPNFGPIVPSAYDVCPGGWPMFIAVINNLIEFLITLIIVFLAPLMIAYAGFLMVTGEGNPGKISEAKGILMNMVIGIVIALSAWLIVDAVMAVLYNQNTPNATGGGVWGVWSSLVGTGGPTCLPQAGALPGDGLNQTPLTGVSANGGVVTPAGQSLPQCSSANTACSPSALQAAGFTATQANVMSCIAVTESSGIPTQTNGNAVGLFQIMLTANPLVGSACAKYNNGNSTINCPALCKGNDGAALQTAACQPCVQAAQDAQCNAQSAQNLVSQSGYTPWTCSGCNSSAASCVQQYGG